MSSYCPSPSHCHLPRHHPPRSLLQYFPRKGIGPRAGSGQTLDCPGTGPSLLKGHPQKHGGPRDGKQGESRGTAVLRQAEDEGGASLALENKSRAGTSLRAVHRVYANSLCPRPQSTLCLHPLLMTGAKNTALRAPDGGPTALSPLWSAAPCFTSEVSPRRSPPSTKGVSGPLRSWGLSQTDRETFPPLYPVP